MKDGRKVLSQCPSLAHYTGRTDRTMTAATFSGRLKCLGALFCPQDSGLDTLNSKTCDDWGEKKKKLDSKIYLSLEYILLALLSILWIKEWDVHNE